MTCAQGSWRVIMKANVEVREKKHVLIIFFLGHGVGFCSLPGLGFGPIPGWNVQKKFFVKRHGRILDGKSKKVFF